LTLLVTPSAASAGGTLVPGPVNPPTPPPVETEVGNNLSVPTHFVPGTAGAPALRVPCPSPAVNPTGPTALFNGVPYFLQKTAAIWSAACDTPASASAKAAWGSNLTNGRPQRAGRPIRVEMGLTASDTGTGYVVENLTPDELDRNATYGTRGTPTQMPFMVWTGGATLTVKKLDTGATFTVPFSTEINSTGKVVYGFNWSRAGGVANATTGTYELTFKIPSTSGVTITGVEPGEAGNVSNPDASTVTVTITVVSGGGSLAPGPH
jgi:hypothetical protein